MSRAGLTLIEIIVALLLFATGALGLAATSAAITRQARVSLTRSRSASMARERSEKAQSGICGAISSGSEWRYGIQSTWTAVGGNAVTLEQQLDRSSTASVRTDRFFSAVPCS